MAKPTSSICARRGGISSRVVRHRISHALLLTAMVGACRDAVAPNAPSAAINGGLAAESENISAAFTIEDLGTLPGGTNSYGEAINLGGDIAGISTTSGGLQHAVLWIGATPTDLGVPFGTQSAAFGVNDSRTVVGYTTDGTTKYGALWKNGGVTLIGGPTAPHTASASAINNSDVVTGYYLNAGTSFHAYRYSAPSGLVDLHPLGYTNSVGLGISDNGVIVGYVQLTDGTTHAARWASNDIFTDLGTLGGTIGQAEAVNSAGTVVGESEDASGKISPFSWRTNAHMVGTGLSGFALGISDAGRAVGYRALPTKNIAATSKNTTSLTTLAQLPGGTNSYAVGVNRCGHVAGIADKTGGAFRAVRWTIASCD